MSKGSENAGAASAGAIMDRLSSAAATSDRGILYKPRRDVIVELHSLVDDATNVDPSARRRGAVIVAFRCRIAPTPQHCATLHSMKGSAAIEIPANSYADGPHFPTGCSAMPGWPSKTLPRYRRDDFPGDPYANSSYSRCCVMRRFRCRLQRRFPCFPQ